MATSEDLNHVSELYVACRNGDVEFVKNYLMKLSSNKCNPNAFESSIKSTSLHAAAYYGHAEIVQLLIEYGCDRSQLNGYGLTAYEEAANDQIRQLFKRPTNDSNMRRFQDENANDIFDIVKKPKEYIKKKDIATDKLQSQLGLSKTSSVQGYKTKIEKKVEIGYATTSIAMCQSRVGRFIADKFHRGAPMSLNSMGNRIQEIIDKEITSINHPESHKANELLKQFLSNPDNGGIEHLIRLYTLETRFYHVLKQSPMPLAVPMYITLETLKDRYYQGQSYRGVTMDDDDIATYQWAVQNHGSLLQTKHFSSTSIKLSIAEEFAVSASKKPNKVRRNTVLLKFNFPVKSEQAINLSKISDTQTCLSEFEDEAEVLILPWTLFQVNNVERESSSSYTIYLTNVLLPHKNMLSSLKWILKHPKGSINRFNEHFPKTKPKTELKQVMSTFHSSWSFAQNILEDKFE